jgi:hypothetical protein
MPNIDVFDQIVPSESVTLQFFTHYPSLTGTVIDDEFDLKELFLASILDLPFQAYFVEIPGVEVQVFDQLAPTDAVTLQFFTPPPSLTGTVIDDEFDLKELFLASILDLPFNAYFIESPNVEISVFDAQTPTEFVAIQMFPVQAAEEVQEARGGLPSRARELQRLRRLAKLRKILDDEEVLLLME